MLPLGPLILTHDGLEEIRKSRPTHTAEQIAALTIEPYVLPRTSSPNRLKSDVLSNSKTEDGQNNNVHRCIRSRTTMRTNRRHVMLYLKKIDLKA